MKNPRALLSRFKRTLRERRVLATGWLFASLCRMVMALRPSSRWYFDMLFFSRLIVKVARTMGPGMVDPSLEARLLHRFIDTLSEGGRRFFIPTRFEGAEILEAAHRKNVGFVCCTAHVPLVKLFIPYVRKVLGEQTELVAVVKYPTPEGCVDVWNDEPLRAIASGPGVLLQTRSLLRRGGCLLLLTDKEQGEYISSNIFRFVGRVQSSVIMGFPHLLEDGTVLLQLIEAPAPECRNEVEIRANLDFIAQMVRSILAGGLPPEKVRASVMPMAQAQVNVAERGREVDRIQLYSRSQLKARTRRLEQLLADQSISVADHTLYEKRLKLLRNELQIRAQSDTRSEFGPDGRPLAEDG